MSSSDGIAWCASAMEAAQAQLDGATANLANASTDGFRARVDEANARQPMLRPTGRTFDLALSGPGHLLVVGRDPHGNWDLQHPQQTRGGEFMRDRHGHVVDAAGRALLGTHGVLAVPQDVTIASNGTFSAGGRTVGHVTLDGRATLRSGFLESSDVDAIGEMVVVLDAQRSFETAQKALVAVDGARQKAVTDVGQLR